MQTDVRCQQIATSSYNYFRIGVESIPRENLPGIPAEAFEYRLGKQSALIWVLDEYHVRTDKRIGISSDPNRAEDKQYIVRLVGHVIRVRVETVKIVNRLPEYFAP